jgi:hypothetical protein
MVFALLAVVFVLVTVRVRDQVRQSVVANPRVESTAVRGSRKPPPTRAAGAGGELRAESPTLKAARVVSVPLSLDQGRIIGTLYLASSKTSSANLLVRAFMASVLGFMTPVDAGGVPGQTVCNCPIVNLAVSIRRSGSRRRWKHRSPTTYGASKTSEICNLQFHPS